MSGRDIVRYLCTTGRFCQLREWDPSWKPSRNIPLISDQQLPYFSKKLVGNIGSEEKTLQTLRVFIDATHQAIRGIIVLDDACFTEYHQYNDELWLNGAAEIMFGFIETLPPELASHFGFKTADDRRCPNAGISILHTEPNIFPHRGGETSGLNTYGPDCHNIYFVKDDVVPFDGFSFQCREPDLEGMKITTHCMPPRDSWNGLHFCSSEPSDIAKKIADEIMHTLTMGQAMSCKSEVIREFFQSMPQARLAANERITQHRQEFERAILEIVQRKWDSLSRYERLKRRLEGQKKPELYKDIRIGQTTRF